MPHLTKVSSCVSHAFRAMFAARKRVFIDLLRWDLPVLVDEYEIDQFDNTDAHYLILLDENGEHRASTRLLRTDRPHILSDLFPMLCPAPIPAGPTTREITRFCLDPRLSTSDRRRARNELVTALVGYALNHGITDYTGVAGLAWFRQIKNFGWSCEALGPTMTDNGQPLVALHIRIDETTIEGLKRGGCYAEPTRTLSGTVGALA